MDTKTASVETKTTERGIRPLREMIRQSIENYLKSLGDQEPADLYRLVLEQVEVPLLESVLQHANYNQCEATRWLGISRTTLRSRLRRYELKQTRAE